jgi:hypothetical protein
MEYQMTASQRLEYTTKLTENPYRWAQDSIDRILELVEAGSHEPSDDGEVDPDELVATNRDFLVNQIALFQYLKLDPPVEFQATIDIADAFLSEGTPEGVYSTRK